MKNLTDIFLASAPVRTRLSWGYSKVVLKSISNVERRDKNNLKVDRFCYMRFANLDEETGKSVAESEFSYFGVSKAEYAPRNIVRQYLQLNEIAKRVIPTEAIAEIKGRMNGVFKSYGAVIASAVTHKKNKSTPTASEHKLMKEFQVILSDTFADELTPYAGADGIKFHILAVTGYNGKFQELPQEDVGFTADADADVEKLLIPIDYKKWLAKKDIKETSDSDVLGEALDISTDSLDLGGDNLDLDLGEDIGDI